MESFEEKKEIYGADQIQVLEGLEAVRKRPGMYIGSTNERGLHHIVYEIVDNSVDEALAGFCSEIIVTIEKDNTITVRDNGRGIPVDEKKGMGKSALEIVFTVLHAGGKFGGGGYKVSGGLHGVGASVVNALSKELTVKVFKDEKIYSQTYNKGKPITKVEVIGTCDKNEHGTEVHFVPDNEIFEVTTYNFDTLKTRLRETAFLTKGLKIVLRDLREGKEKEKIFYYEGGIKEFVEFINKGKDPAYDKVFYCEGEKDKIYVEVALQHNNEYQEATYTFVNNINTPEGGTHLTGFKNTLTKVVNDYAKDQKYLKEDDENISGEDIREGFIVLINLPILSISCTIPISLLTYIIDTSNVSFVIVFFNSSILILPFSSVDKYETAKPSFSSFFTVS